MSNETGLPLRQQGNADPPPPCAPQPSPAPPNVGNVGLGLAGQLALPQGGPLQPPNNQAPGANQGQNVPRYMLPHCNNCGNIQHDGDCWPVCASCGYRHPVAPVCPAWALQRRAAQNTRDARAALRRAEQQQRAARATAGGGGGGGHGDGGRGGGRGDGGRGRGHDGGRGGRGGRGGGHGGGQGGGPFIRAQNIHIHMGQGQQDVAQALAGNLRVTMTHPRAVAAAAIGDDPEIGATRHSSLAIRSCKTAKEMLVLLVVSVVVSVEVSVEVRWLTNLMRRCVTGINCPPLH